MSYKELSSYPLFIANRKNIYDDALNLAINKKSSGVYRLDPKIVEFRVHYVTNVSNAAEI